MRHRKLKRTQFEHGAWLHAVSQCFVTRGARLAAALLALLLFIAPTWHVCALGGNMECHDHAADNASSEYSNKPNVLICGLPEVEEEKHAAVCKPSSHSDGEVCECPDHQNAAVATLSEPHLPHLNENCLARLLWNFPAALVLLFVLFLLWSRRITGYVSSHIALVSAFTHCYEARGPPVFSPV